MQDIYVNRITDMILLIVGSLIIGSLYIDLSEVKKYFYDKKSLKASKIKLMSNSTEYYLLATSIILLIMITVLTLDAKELKEGLYTRPEIPFIMGYVILAFLGTLVFGVMFVQLKRQYIKINDLQRKYTNKQLSMYHRIYDINEEMRDFQQETMHQLKNMKQNQITGQLEHLVKQAHALSNCIEMNPNLLTGNKLIDAILGEKFEVAKKSHIKMTARISMPEELNIEAGELCLIFEETLDVILAYYQAAIDILGNVDIEGIWLKGYFMLKFKFLKSFNEDKMNDFSLAKELDEVQECLIHHQGKMEIREEEDSYKIEIIFNPMEKVS